ncbi:FKBP-type peptidyl-prolyl cis-trans isomerase [Marinagarivorans cellulosilyticus]|uniref:Peptidyl-prolyl cis-trans isomerase n=1 Tax=Marinagarivorans cellulosilyticus TaxID=2721545 RepID=A0AAN1WL18_9GAMM|nr:FKBP-type peptidyl-prolyl cis-trans isomerase [Marinagarivorans cellulosilyticus]BCD99539.1 FKBP-type peptidyl-prolyl cis-trans isomerase FkpA [Marinagarivorans cellulosilyticus]
MAKKQLNKGSSGQNRKASEDFMDKYRQKQGVQQTSSGLLYRVVEQGDGLTPVPTDSIQVNQRIQLVGGKIIGDTYKEGLPDEFSMKEAIPGIREGLQLMQEGARFEFVVPPELAWGKKGVGDKIGPNAVLIFDVRLLKVLV